MSNKHNSDKKYKLAAITTCGLLTALCVCYLIILILSFIRHINAPIIDKQSIVYFILGSYKIGISIVFSVLLILIIAIIISLIVCGINLAKRQFIYAEISTSLILPSIYCIALLICSIYPFIINTIRICVHGYIFEYYLVFWLSMATFLFSTVGIIFNRVSAKQSKLQKHSF